MVYRKQTESQEGCVCCINQCYKIVSVCLECNWSCIFIFQFCLNNQKAQKYLLGGIEILVGDVHKATLLPKVPHILKELYDCDIVEEEVLIEWGKKVCSSQLLTKQ